MEAPLVLDDIDRELLAGIKELKEASITELSARVYRTQDAVRRRLNKLEQKRLIRCKQKRKRNGKLAHFFSLDRNLEEHTICNMQEGNYSPEIYLSRLSKNQLRIFIATAIVKSGFAPEIHAASGIRNPSSSHSALTKLLKDETIDRGESKEGKAGYRYSFNHKIPVEDCFAELKKRVESGDIEFDSLSELVNEYLTDEDSRIINYRKSEQNGRSFYNDSETEILTNARHIEERVTTQENCYENDVEEEELPEFTISTLKLCISEINSTGKKTLDVICTYPRCSAKQIAKFVGTKSTSLSRYFNQLQDLHLIDYEDLDDISDENRGRGSRHYSISDNLNSQTVRKIIHTPELVTDLDPVYDVTDTDSTDSQLLQKEVLLAESPKTQIKNAIDVICNFLTVQDEALVIEAKLKSAKKQIKAYEQILGEEFMDLLTDRARQSAEQE